jgi:hypothetical protein
MMMGTGNSSMYVGVIEVVLNFAIFSALLYFVYYLLRGYRHENQSDEVVNEFTLSESPLSNADLLDDET